MTLVSPAEMPSPLKVSSKTFDLAYNQLISPVGSGFIQSIDRSTPAWAATFQTPPLVDLSYQAMSAFLDELEGAANTFLGFDPRRTVPYAYRGQNGLSSPWGSPQIVSTNYTSSLLYFTGFNPFAQLTSGDYFSYLQGNTWYLFRATQTVAADSSGNLTIRVKPRPLPLITVVYARLYRACCAMKMLATPKITDTVDSFPSYSFSGVGYTERTTTFIPPAPSGAVTNWSGTISAGGTAQSLMPARANRKLLMIFTQVPLSSGDVLWVTINGTPAAIGASGSIPLLPGYGQLVYTTNPPDGPISIIGSISGSEFSAQDA